MKQVDYDLSSLIEQLNNVRSTTSTTAAGDDGNDAISRISFILSKQIDTLTCIDHQTRKWLFVYRYYEFNDKI